MRRPARHNCPVPGCAQPERSGILLCETHWARVPARLRREVVESWIAQRFAGGSPEGRAKLEAWRDATRRAILAAGRTHSWQ